MIFESKFNLGDTVYYWSVKQVKVLQGTIDGISLFSSQDEKGVEINITYHVRPKAKKFELSESTPEHLIFREREDVFEFCMELTKDI